MTTKKIAIYNVQTGEIVEREANYEELAQFEAYKAEAAVTAEAEAEAQTKRLIALAKLEQLGLSVDDLQALGF